jgi:hypothetical protein
MELKNNILAPNTTPKLSVKPELNQPKRPTQAQLKAQGLLPTKQPAPDMPKEVNVMNEFNTPNVDVDVYKQTANLYQTKNFSSITMNHINDEHYDMRNYVDDLHWVDEHKGALEAGDEKALREYQQKYYNLSLKGQGGAFQHYDVSNLNAGDEGVFKAVIGQKNDILPYAPLNSESLRGLKKNLDNIKGLDIDSPEYLENVLEFSNFNNKIFPREMKEFIKNNAFVEGISDNPLALIDDDFDSLVGKTSRATDLITTVPNYMNQVLGINNDDIKGKYQFKPVSKAMVDAFANGELEDLSEEEYNNVVNTVLYTDTAPDLKWFMTKGGRSNLDRYALGINSRSILDKDGVKALNANPTEFEKNAYERFAQEEMPIRGFDKEKIEAKLSNAKQNKNKYREELVFMGNHIHDDDKDVSDFKDSDSKLVEWSTSYTQSSSFVESINTNEAGDIIVNMKKGGSYTYKGDVKAAKEFIKHNGTHFGKFYNKFLKLKKA